jgi:hypothetical protein
MAEKLAAAREIQGGFARALTLSLLIPHLPEALKSEAAAEAFLGFREIQDDYPQAEALGELAHYLPENLLAEALATVREVRSEENEPLHLAS